MELSEDAVALLAKILNVSGDKVKEYAEAEDGEKQLVELNANNLKKKQDEGHKKGLGMTSKAYKTALKSTFDIDVTGETAEEMFESLKEQLLDRGAEDVSDDAVKAHPAYKALQTDLTRKEQEFNKNVEKRVKEQMKEKDAQYQKEIKAAKRMGIMTEAEREAERWLTENNAILSTDTEKRRKQIKELAKKLDSYEIEKDEDGTFLISQNDKAVTNNEGHNASLSDIFREYDYLYNFQQTQQRQSTQLNPNGSGGGQKRFEHFKGEVPKNEAELTQLRYDRVNGKLTKEAFKEAEAAYEAGKTA